MKSVIHLISNYDHSATDDNNWYVSTFSTLEALKGTGYKVVMHSPPKDKRLFISALHVLLKKVKHKDIVYIISTGDFGYDKFTLLKLFKPSIKIFWEIHGVEEELLWFRTDRRALLIVAKNKILRFIYSRLISASFCLSKPLLEYSKNKLKIKNSFLISSIVSDKIFDKKRNGIQPRDGFILHPFKSHNSYVVYWAGGEMYPWQSLNVVEEVAKKTYLLDKSIIFVIVGTNLWHKFDFINNIVFYKRTTFEDNIKMASLANVCLALYSQNIKKVTGYDFYYSPRKLVEFMSLGKPVITTKTGETEEIIKDNSNGYLVNNNPSKITKIILQLKNHPEIAKAIGINAKREVLKKYRVKNLTNTYNIFFSQLRSTNQIY